MRVARVFLLMLALPLLAGASDKRSARDLSGAWEGSYICGLTAMRLKLVMGGHPVGTVAGSFIIGDPAKPTGRFRVRGMYDASANALALRGAEWEDYPREGEWATLDLVGAVDWDKHTIAGKVLGKDCTTFSVTRAGD